MFAFLNIGNTELIIILVIILLLFGAKKLPELAKGLGKSMQEFKKATREVEDNFRDAMDDKPQDPPRRAQTPPPDTSDKTDTDSKDI